MAHKPDVALKDELAAQMYYSMLPSLAQVGLSLQGADHMTDPYTIPKPFLPTAIKSSRSARLCNACLRMNVDTLYTKDGYKHSNSLADLPQSVGSCAVCDMILKEMHSSLQCSRSESFGKPLASMSLVDLLKEFQEALAERSISLPSQLPIFLLIQGSECADHRPREPEYLSLAPSKDKWLSIGTRVMHRPTGMSMTMASFGYLVLHSADDGSQRPLFSRGSAEKTIARLRAWLEGCRSQDSESRAAEQGTPLPTRVLDLGENSCHDADVLGTDLRLIETHGRVGTYIALSYCWGGYTGFRTLRSNYRQRLGGIAFKELPPVFAQAVHLTRALNIRYLWIDALCIVQDDKEDWTREAVRLSDIYWHTVCRFAVTSSKSPLEGFFPPKRMTNSVPVPHIKYGSSKDSASPHSTLYITLPRFYTDDVDKGHLNTRGWVLQERLLAPRTIHFTRNHIYCENETDICGEDWVRRSLTWLSCIDKVSHHSQIDLFPHRNSFPVPPKEEHHIVYQPWLKISEMFSRCQLTYDTDRLAAMVGLITRKQMDEYRGIKNLLGLWEHDLHIELAWVASTRDSTSGRFEGLKFLQHLALPSWTWMAYEGPISFVEDRRSKRDERTVQARPARAFELLEARVPDMMTPLPLSSPAWLTLYTSVRSLHGISQERKDLLSGKESREELANTSPFRFNPKTGTVPIALTELTQARAFYDQAGRWIGDLSLDDPSESTNQLYCAHLSVLQDVDHSRLYEQGDGGNAATAAYPDYILSYALVLKRVVMGVGNDAYRRVGLAQVDYLWMKEGQRTVIKLA